MTEVFERPVYLFVHVPKCAGRTIEIHMERHLDQDQYLYLQRLKAPARYFSAVRYGIPADFDPRRVRVISGHPLGASIARRLPGREIRQAVLLRDPLGMLVSFHNFRMSIFTREGWPHVSFERFYRSRHLNPAATFLLRYYFELPTTRIWRMSLADKFEFIAERLADFWFVGDYRRCDELIRAASAELGIPDTAERANVLERRVLSEHDLSESMQARVLEENALDLRLYETFKDRGFASGTIPAAGAPFRDHPVRTFAHETRRLVENTRLDLEHRRLGRRTGPDRPKAARR